MSNDNFFWPPPFTIVKNPRSKRLSLRVSLYKGLELVVPKNISTQKAIEFLNSKYDWVQKHVYLISKKEVNLQLPSSIHLPTIQEEWQVRSNISLSTKAIFRENTGTQCLYLDEKLPINSSFELLRNWLKKKAKQHLPELLLSCSKNYQLPFCTLSIRLQRSRWGSCSKNKNINLNSKLLLLPFELTHYVMVHELVHTIHFNHSSLFWGRVENIIPHYRQQLMQLKKIEHQMPNWLYY
jgi:predicted metal-dependent hydrolase